MTAPLSLKDIQAPDGSPVPRAWTQALVHLQRAEIARDCVRYAKTQMDRDDAAVRFGQQLEMLFEQMLELQKAGVTGAITNILCKRARA